MKRISNELARVIFRVRSTFLGILALFCGFCIAVSPLNAQSGLSQNNYFTQGSTISPVILTVAPMINQRVVTRFSLGNFERMRHRQLSVASQFRSQFQFGVPADEMIFEDDENYLTSSQSSVYRGQYCSPGSSCGAGLSCGRRPRSAVAPCSLWMQNYGDFLNQNTHNMVVGYSTSAYGFNLGYDFYQDSMSIWGIAVGGAFTNIDGKDKRQKSDFDSFLVSIYGGYNWSNWNLLGSIGYVQSGYQTSRLSNATNLFQDATWHDNVLFGSFDLSTYLCRGDISIAPFFSGDLIGSEHKDGSETGGDRFNVSR
ncbi:MAG: autotransporter outer membrane beta-barrel domain-containing protein, partial [Thermoguttaceae bacterium]